MEARQLLRLLRERRRGLRGLPDARTIFTFAPQTKNVGGGNNSHAAKKATRAHVAAPLSQEPTTLRRLAREGVGEHGGWVGSALHIVSRDRE